MDPRVSYLHAADNRLADEELTHMFNPILNLSEVFNSFVGETDGASLLNVFLRVRPVLHGEAEQTEEDGVPQVRIVDQHTVLLTAPASSNTYKNTAHGITKLTHRFSFSHVYGPSTGQVELYDSTTKSMVNKFISGQNCLLFTYGATNSGKTYTIQGEAGNAEIGLLPRILHGLFSSVGNRQYPRRDIKPLYHCALTSLDERETRVEEELREALLRGGLDGSVITVSSLSKSTLSVSSTACDSGRAGSPDVSLCSSLDSKETVTCPDDSLLFAVFVSFAEVYNETVYDLLERLPPGCRNRVPHCMGEDRNGSSYIKGLRQIRVDTAEEALRVLEVGRQNLHFAATRLNHNSSRSHCIFTMKLVQMASADTPKYARVSMFSVCDLAGAERVVKTQGTGDRLKEAGNINSSLLVLSRCISALRQNQMAQRSALDNSSGSTQGSRRREVPVPFRDSKLTRLLHGFFFGQGVAAMIVNISQAPALFDETLQVLKFSAIAKKVLTSQEPAPPQQIQLCRRPSQLSRLIRHSLNKSFCKRNQRSSAVLAACTSDAGRLSVPWRNADTSANFTFGEDAKEDTMLTVKEDTEDEDQEEEEEEDERVQMLLELNKKLCSALERLNKEKKEQDSLMHALEVRVRSELCTEFSKQLVQIECNWKQRLEKQQMRSNDLHDWRLEKLTEYYEDTRQSRKRPRTDGSYDGDASTTVLDDSIVEYRHQARLQQLEQQVADLKESTASKEAELVTLSATLKKTSDVGNKSQEEATKLKFQLATLTQNYDALKDKLCAAELVAKSAVPESTALSVLQQQLRDSEAALEAAVAELQSNREMLVEAAEAYAIKEEELGLMTVSVSQHQRALTEQGVSLEQTTRELVATQQLASEHMATLREQETALEEADAAKHALQQTVKELREAAVEASCGAAQAAAAATEREMVLVSDKNRLLVEVSALRCKVQETESRLADSSSELHELRLSKNSFREQLEHVQEMLAQEQQRLQLTEDVEQKRRDNQEESGVEEKSASSVEAWEKLRNERSTMVTDVEALTQRVIASAANNSTPEQEEQPLKQKMEYLEENDHCKKALYASYELHAELNSTAAMISQPLQLTEVEQLLSKSKAEMQHPTEQLSGSDSQLVEACHSAGHVTEVERQKDEVLQTLKNEVCILRNQLKNYENINMENNLLKAQEQIIELQRSLQDKLEQLQKCEDVMNKKVQMQLTEKEEISLALLVEAESVKSFKCQIEELNEKITAITKEKELCMSKIEECKKVHVSTMRYKDCELSSARKEADDARQQASRLREEQRELQQRLVTAEQRLAESDASRVENTDREDLQTALARLACTETELEAVKNELATAESFKKDLIGKKQELETTRQDLETAQSLLNTARRELELNMKDLHYTKQEVNTCKQDLLAANAKLENVVDELEHSNKVLEDVQLQLSTVKKSLECSEANNQELLHAVSELKSKLQDVTSDDKNKLDKMKEDLKKSREICQVLQKEACAMREARAAEVSDISSLRAQVTALQQQCETKDEEISTLQAEVKKALCSTPLPVTVPVVSLPDVSVKRERSMEHELREQLSAKDAQLCVLMQQLSVARDQSVVSTSVHFLPSPPPPPPSSTRSRRGRAASHDSENDTLAVDTPMRVKTIGGASQQVKEMLSTEGSRTRRSTRSRRVVSIAFNTTTDEGSDGNETQDSHVEEVSDEWEAPTASARGAGSRRCKGRGAVRRGRKTPARLYNPHLDNQENMSSLANQCDSASAPSARKNTSTKTRRRRPLYVNMEAEPLHCSPQLVEPLPPVDSPHTVVRRKLRTKPK